MTTASNQFNLVYLSHDLAGDVYDLFHKTHSKPAITMCNYALTVGDEWHEFLPYDVLRYKNDWLDDSSEFISVRDDMAYTRGKLIGACSVNTPVGRFNEKGIYELTRICFLDTWKPANNTQRKFFSRFIREIMNDWVSITGAKKFVTYIHHDQSGKYLEYAGFQCDKICRYSPNHKGWSTRPGRGKGDLITKKRFIREV